MFEVIGHVRRVFTALFCSVLFFSTSFSRDSIPEPIVQPNPKRMIDPNTYYDSWGSFDFTMNMLAFLSHRFQYFGFYNFSQLGFDKNETSNYSSEQHLYWVIKDKGPLDLSFQVMSLSGASNDALRLGFRYRIGATPKLVGFFNRMDNNTQRDSWFAQIEHFYRLNLFNACMYVTAFSDQDVFYDSKNLFVFETEHQTGLPLIDQFYLVAEYRLNEYLLSKKSGFGLGFEYQIVL